MRAEVFACHPPAQKLAIWQGHFASRDLPNGCGFQTKLPIGNLTRILAQSNSAKNARSLTSPQVSANGSYWTSALKHDGLVKW